MTRGVVTRFLTIFLFVLGAGFVCLGADPDQRQKVAEGVYTKLIKGAAVKGSEQTWTLWRLTDGTYELEDHFQIAPNPAEQLAAELGGKSLRSQMQKKAVQSDFSEHLSSDHHALTITVSGSRLLDKKNLVMASCTSKSSEIICKGRESTAKLQTNSQTDLWYSFPHPLLLRPFILHRAADRPEQIFELAMLVLGEEEPTLVKVMALLKYAGEDTIQVGDRSFTLGKYVLEVRSEDYPAAITFWASPRGMVAAMEESRFPGERIALTAFKKYADF
jgi:hypothetical protein